MVVGEFTQETQLVVIGGGPAGYSAAFRAAELGVQTAIVDPRPALGGVCLHQGCVPSKTLIGVAQSIADAEHAAQFGIEFARPRIDLAKVHAWTVQTVDKLARGLDAICRKLGVERIVGAAHFEDGKHLAIRGGSIPRLKFRKAIIATGSRPIMPPFAPQDSRRVLAPQDALKVDQRPESVLIVGDDYMALELASIYAGLGAAVTLACPGEAILPDADADLTRHLLRAMKSQISNLRLSIAVADLKEKKNAVEARFGSDRDRANFDIAIVSADLAPNLAGLELGKTHVKLSDDGFIAVDDHCRTSDPRILAAGDVTGPPLLADRAIHMGRVAGEVAAGVDSVFDARAIPMVVFTEPNLAWCGLTENEAKQLGIEFAVAKMPWGASGRAVGLGRHDGLTKIIYDPGSKLVLGVGICGHGATEMIAEGCLAIEMGAVLDDLAATIHPHPTASELLSDAAAQAETKSSPSMHS